MNSRPSAALLGSVALLCLALGLLTSQDSNDSNAVALHSEQQQWEVRDQDNSFFSQDDLADDSEESVHRMLRRGGSSSSGSSSSSSSSNISCRDGEGQIGVHCVINLGGALCIVLCVTSCLYGYKIYNKKTAENESRFFKKKQEEVNPNVYATPNGGIGLFCNKEHELEMYYGNPYSRQYTICDYCNDKISSQEMKKGFPRCRLCECDMCHDCMKKKQPQAPPPPSPFMVTTQQPYIMNNSKGNSVAPLNTNMMPQQNPSDQTMQNQMQMQQTELQQMAPYPNNHAQQQQQMPPPQQYNPAQQQQMPMQQMAPYPNNPAQQQQKMPPPQQYNPAQQQQQMPMQQMPPYQQQQQMQMPMQHQQMPPAGMPPPPAQQASAYPGYAQGVMVSTPLESTIDTTLQKPATNDIVTQ